MHSLVIGQWRLSPEINALININTGVSVSTEPLNLRVLYLLACNPGVVLSRDSIRESIWQNRAVADDNLSRIISDLRKALGDTSPRRHYIETVSKRGYRLIAPVSAVSAAISPTAQEHPCQPGQPGQPAPAAVPPSVIRHPDAPEPVPWGLTMQRAFTPFYRGLAAGFTLVMVFSLLLTWLLSGPEELSVPDLQSLLQVRLSRELNSYPQYTVSQEASADAASTLKLVLHDALGDEIWSLQRKIDTREGMEQAVNDFMQGVRIFAASLEDPVVNALPPALRDPYRRAMHYLDRRGLQDLETAVTLFDQILDEVPNHVESLLGKAEAYQNMFQYKGEMPQDSSDYRLGELLVAQAARLNPEHPRVIAASYRLSLASNSWAEDQRALEGLLARYPGCRECIVPLHNFYLTVGWFRRDAQMLEEQLRYFPLSVELHAMLGEIHSRLGDASRTAEHARLMAILGADKAYDSAAFAANAALMAGDSEQWLANSLVVAERMSPRGFDYADVYRAIAANDLVELQRVAENIPASTGFNLLVSAQKTDALLGRVEKGIAEDRVEILSMIHGWMPPENQVSRFYLNGLRKLQQNERIAVLLDEVGLVDFWRSRQQWPDYCRSQDAPAYCFSGTGNSV